ncbi:MAG: hypothetical protein WDA60_16915 [Acidimicrobiia bacterium]
MSTFVEKIEAVTSGLAAAAVPHAFGGALALAFCVGQPRATADIDVNVFVTPDEVDRVFAALPDGVVANATSARLARHDGQVRVWWDETAVDLFFSYHSQHDEAARRTRRVAFGEVQIPVLSCTDLAFFKVIFNRTRDWADLEAMTEARSYDRAEVLRGLDGTLGPDADPVRRFRALRDRRSAPEPMLRRVLESGGEGSPRPDDPVA